MLSSECSLTFLRASGTSWRMAYRFRTSEAPERLVGTPGTAGARTEIAELTFSLKVKPQEGKPFLKAWIGSREVKLGGAFMVKDVHPLTDSDGWSWSFELETSAPAMLVIDVATVRMVISAAGKKTRHSGSEVLRTDSFWLGSVNLIPNQRIGVSDPPRLNLALTQAWVPISPLSPDASLEGKVQAMLEHLWQRLQGGLSDAWAHAERQRGEAPLSERSEAPEDDAEAARNLDEEWARAIAEVLTQTPYCAPGQVYLSGHADDPVLLNWFQDDENPSYPLLMACQQLCTAALISRGYYFQFSSPQNPQGTKTVSADNVGTSTSGTEPGKSSRGSQTVSAINAGPSTSGTVKNMGGRWLIDLSGTRPLPSSAQIPTAGVDTALKNPFSLMSLQSNDLEGPIAFGPCSLFVFAAGDNIVDPKSKTLAHVAFVIRTENIHPEIKRFQFFDTGGMRTSGRDAGLMLARNAQKILPPGCGEEPWISGQEKSFDFWGGGSPFCGVGLMPVLKRETIRASIDRTRRARPLGLVRVFLVKRTTAGPGHRITDEAFVQQQLVFASPLLPMWAAAPTDNFSISRFFWSLRGMPGASELEAVVLVYIPKASLTHVLAQADRSMGTETVISALREQLKSEHQALIRQQENLASKLSASKREKALTDLKKQVDDYHGKMNSLPVGELLTEYPYRQKKEKKDHSIPRPFLMPIMELRSTEEGNAAVSYRFHPSTEVGSLSRLTKLSPGLIPFENVTFSPELSQEQVKTLTKLLPAYFRGLGAEPIQEGD